MQCFSLSPSFAAEEICILQKYGTALHVSNIFSTLAMLKYRRSYQETKLWRLPLDHRYTYNDAITEILILAPSLGDCREGYESERSDFLDGYRQLLSGLATTFPNTRKITLQTLVPKIYNMPFTEPPFCVREVVKQECDKLGAEFADLYGAAKEDAGLEDSSLYRINVIESIRAKRQLGSLWHDATVF